MFVCDVCLALVVVVVLVISFLGRTGSDTKSSMQEWFCDVFFRSIIWE